MAEYYRDTTHQFCDSDLCMVVDTVTGKHERIFPASTSIGRFDEALEWLKKNGWRDRHTIVKLQCVGAFPLETAPRLEEN